MSAGAVEVWNIVLVTPPLSEVMIDVITVDGPSVVCCVVLGWVVVCVVLGVVEAAVVVLGVELETC